MPTKRKRATAPDSLPPGKRQAIARWVETSSQPLPSIETCVRFPADDEAMSQAVSQQASQLENLSVSTASSKLSSPSSKYETGLRRRNIRDADKDDTQPDPSNLQELQDLLPQDRASPELTAEMHKELRTTLMAADTEDSVMDVMKLHLLKERWKPGLVQKNATWTQHIPMEPDLLPRLSDPRPDIAYGWSEQAFHDLDVKQALNETYIDEAKKQKQKDYEAEVRSYQAPNPKLYWPVVTVEGKGPRGTLDEVHLQNGYNAAVMLNNIFQLKRKANRPLPYNQALVVTVDFVYYNIEVTYHWVSVDEKGKDVFWGRVLQCWTLRDRTSTQWNSARKGVRNCIEWARKKALPGIRADLAALQEILQRQHARRASVSPNTNYSAHESFLATQLDTVSIAESSIDGDSGRVRPVDEDLDGHREQHAGKSSHFTSTCASASASAAASASASAPASTASAEPPADELTAKWPSLPRKQEKAINRVPSPLLSAAQEQINLLGLKAQDYTGSCRDIIQALTRDASREVNDLKYSLSEHISEFSSFTSHLMADHARDIKTPLQAWLPCAIRQCREAM